MLGLMTTEDSILVTGEFTTPLFVRLDNFEFCPMELLCCLGPSSLNRPHPSHSQAQHDFTARRLIRAVFAVRERLGDPRAVPGFRCTFRPDMPSSTTPGSSTSISSRAGMSTLAFTAF